MSDTARVAAQAKVNLLLHVLARETSGYHSIETVFQRIDLADDVTVRIPRGGERSLDCAGPAMPANGLGPTERNLAHRAALAYADATGWPNGFAIEIVKRIPAGGGLGGGSADAGAVLRALDALSPAPLGAALVEIAAPLGADVPFMSTDRPIALGWGRGERLLPLTPLEARTVVVLVPHFATSTADAYGWLAAARGDYVPRARLLDPSLLAAWDDVAAVATNDFQRVVGGRHPEIAQLIDQLRAADARIALLAGSGSSVFGVFDHSPDVAAIARSAGVTAIATQTSARVARVELDR